ncbi:hypothetical protein BD414DRAFT_492276 [Trametes punicea]|nr:hypothetical protein BD414DRAFT_492276 [Trametes punicea]
MRYIFRRLLATSGELPSDRRALCHRPMVRCQPSLPEALSTKWCDTCTAIQPALAQLSDEHSDVKFNIHNDDHSDIAGMVWIQSVSAALHASGATCCSSVYAADGLAYQGLRARASTRRPRKRSGTSQLRRCMIGIARIVLAKVDER